MWLNGYSSLNFKFLPCNTMLSMVYAVVVCLSVTLQYCIALADVLVQVSKQL